MRLLRWLFGFIVVGVSGVLAARSVVVRKRSDLAAEFLQALKDDSAVVERCDPTIVSPGMRGDRFSGIADSDHFRFLAFIDADGVHQRYLLIWFGRDGVPGSGSTRLDGLSPGLALIYQRLLDIHDQKKGTHLN